MAGVKIRGTLFLPEQMPDFNKIDSNVENLQKSIMEIRNNKDFYKRLSQGNKSRLTLSMTFIKRINTMLEKIKEEKPAVAVQTFDSFTITT